MVKCDIEVEQSAFLYLVVQQCTAMIKQGVSSLFLGLLGAEERGLDLSNAVLSVD